MRIYKDSNFSGAYKTLLEDLYFRPEHVCSPRGQKINEIMNAVIEIENPIMGLYSNSKRSSQFRYIAAELIFYFTGRNDLKFIEQYASFWKSIANDDNTVNSAYGNLIFTRKNEHNINQWQWAYDCLKNDKDSRQAIMHFNMPDHQYTSNKDFVCTLNGVFHIRDNKLNLIVMMRSNDVILGLPTDVGFFTMLQQQMWKLLKDNCYPDLELGRYTHQACSMHLYERNFQVVKEMLLDSFSPVQIPFIRKNLVDESGTPSDDILNLCKAVENDTDFDHKGDPTLHWILNWVNNKKLVEKN